jgi:hypothetical protein
LENLPSLPPEFALAPIEKNVTLNLLGACSVKRRRAPGSTPVMRGAKANSVFRNVIRASARRSAAAALL